MKAGDVFYNKNDKRKYYIVAYLLYEKEPQVVYKFYGLNKKFWHYKIESLEIFKVSFECGLYYIKLTGRRKR